MSSGEYIKKHSFETSVAVKADITLVTKRNNIKSVARKVNNIISGVFPISIWVA
jgi:hypothetical protein